MEGLNNLPFNHILNHEEFINVIWNVNDSAKPSLHKSNIIFNHNLINSQVLDELQSISGWTPDACSYLTPAEFSASDNFNSTKFSIMQINCRSLQKNFSHLTSLLQSLSCNPSVIALSET